MQKAQILSRLVDILLAEVLKLKGELGEDIYPGQQNRKRYALSRLIYTLLKVLDMQPEEATEDEILELIMRIPDPARKRAKEFVERTMRPNKDAGKDVKHGP